MSRSNEIDDPRGRIDCCGCCGRKMIHHDEAEDTDDPRINCGGDCLGCMREIEADWERAVEPCQCMCGQNHEKHGWREHCPCECVSPADCQKPRCAWCHT